MTISKRVQKELYSAAPAGVLPPLALVAAQQQQTSGKSRRSAAPKGPKKTKSERALAAAIAEENKGKAWTDDEHARFLEALRVYPSGPWKAIADFVGTKNSRQTMTHAQKYRQKHERRERGLRNRTKHRKAARTMVAASTAAATTRVPHAPATTTTTTRSQRLTKRAAGYDALVIPPSTPQHSSMSSHASTESPRSGEESTANDAYVEPLGVDALMESVDATVAAISGVDAYDDAASWEQLKISSISEMFQDFEPMNFLPNMWSTTSLGDIEALASVASVPPSFGANELFSDSCSTIATNPLWG